jgi:hypothetical protein
MNLPVDTRRKVRNSAIVLGCFVTALYLGFIIWSVIKAGR